MSGHGDDRLGKELLQGLGELTAVELEEANREYLRAMYVVVKSAFLYDVNNATLLKACERLARAVNRIRAHHEDAAALEFMTDGVYVNRQLLRLDMSSFEQAEYLFAVWNTMCVAEISAIGDTEGDDWLRFVEAFKASVGPGGDFQTFVKTELPNIRMTPTSGASNLGDTLAVTDRFRALRAYAITVITLSELIDAARAGRRIKPARVKRPLQELITLSRTSASLLMSLAHLKRHKMALYHHMANTAVFTICAAAKLEVPRWRACELAMQAALHDIGRAFVAADPRDTGPSAERQFALQGVRKLVTTGAANPRVLGRAVVANEVRRWVSRELEPGGDTPYTFELAVPSKIIAVAHAYSLLTTPMPGRPGLLPDEALQVIMRDAGRRYDASAVKLIVNTLGVFPVGSTVTLSDGRTAIVTEAPHDAAGPTRPRVKIVRDIHGSQVDGEILDLAGDSGAGVRILRCVDPEEQQINAPAFLLA